MARKPPPAWAVAQQERERRDQRRLAAVPAWGDLDGRTAQRVAMLAAAFILDEHHRDYALADMLHLARPEAARDIATGVAVHALLRGINTVWDIFAATDAFDLATASAWFDVVYDEFVWSPRPDQLIEPVEQE